MRGRGPGGGLDPKPSATFFDALMGCHVHSVDKRDDPLTACIAALCRVDNIPAQGQVALIFVLVYCRSRRLGEEVLCQAREHMGEEVSVGTVVNWLDSCRAPVGGVRFVEPIMFENGELQRLNMDLQSASPRS